MKKTILLFILLVAFQFSVTAQDKRIEEIRRIYQETGQKISEAEKTFAMAKKRGRIAETEIFLLEIVLNKGNTSYPAVGIFREETKFYFTFGGGENPYPDKLLKIVSTTHRSALVERREYLFDSAGQMVFYFEDPNAENMDRTEETRLYFNGGKLHRFLVGDDDITKTNFRRKNDIVQEIIEKQQKLVNVFKNSL